MLPAGTPVFQDPVLIPANDDIGLQLTTVRICSIQAKQANAAMKLLSTHLPIKHLQHLKRIRKPAGASTLDIIVGDTNIEELPAPVQSFLDQHGLQLRSADVPLLPPLTRDQLTEWNAAWPTAWKVPEGGAKAPPPVDQSDVDWWKQLMATAVSHAREHCCGNYAIVADPKTRQVMGEAPASTATHPLHHPIMLAVHHTAVNEEAAWRKQGIVFNHKGRADRGTAPSTSIHTEAPAHTAPHQRPSSPKPQPQQPTCATAVSSPGDACPCSTSQPVPAATSRQPAKTTSTPQPNSSQHYHSPPTLLLDPKRPKLGPDGHQLCPASGSRASASTAPSSNNLPAATTTNGSVLPKTAPAAAAPTQPQVHSVAHLSGAALSQKQDAAHVSGAAPLQVQDMAHVSGAAPLQVQDMAHVSGAVPSQVHGVAHVSGAAVSGAAPAAAAATHASTSAAEAPPPPSQDPTPSATSPSHAAAAAAAGVAAAGATPSPPLPAAAAASTAAQPPPAAAAASPPPGPALDPKARQYLCSGFDCLVMREPCSMCAMALVHSRIQRVVWCLPDARHGVLGSRLRLHGLKSLNHHYHVYRLPLAEG